MPIFQIPNFFSAFLTILFSLAFASSAAKAELSAEIQQYGPGAGETKCIVDAADPYEPSYLIDFGKHKGDCIDASSVRPPLVLANDNDAIQIANFYHNGKFWLARIPRKSVDRVYFQGVPFSKIAFGLITFAHAQVRFHLNQPITLRLQASAKEESTTVDDIIVSSTATHPKGVKYSVLHGKDFGIAARVLSSTSRGVEEIGVDKSSVHQYEIQLDAQQMDQLLVNAIQYSASSGYKERYDLLKNNCAVTAFNILDETIQRPDGIPPFKGKLIWFQDEIEKPALEALTLRKINYKKVQDMNEEMICTVTEASSSETPTNAEEWGSAAGICKFK